MVFGGEEFIVFRKNDTKYTINKKLMREFLTPENIALEVKILLSPNKVILSTNTDKNTNSFSKNVVKKRFKNIYNTKNIIFYY